jgi:thioester reductase-like protein
LNTQNESMESIVQELEKRTNLHPNKLMFAFLDIKGNVKESYTYESFRDRTNAIAAYIFQEHQLTRGDRVLLAYPPGLETICAFFACAKLGLIPVPVYPPSAQGFQASVRKINFIAKDCGAVAILTDSAYYWSIKVHLERNGSEGKGFVSGLKWIVSDETSARNVEFPKAHSNTLFLQYTSGSTNNPKGVIVTHENIIYNCNSVVDHDPIGVSWLPQYHDMGLIGYYLNFAIKGGTTYGFSPAHFIQRPALWLETITRYAGSASSAPNFAYEYCLLPGRIPEETLAKLDLSTLRFLMTAAEPVNPKIYKAFLEKFKPYGLEPKSFFAAYGLAEFSLAVSNYGTKIHSFDSQLLKKNKVKAVQQSRAENGVTELISCGRPLRDTEVKIVDISSELKEVPQGRVGEIWLNGTSKCIGYWNQPELSKQTFQARLQGSENGATWLRTGDLGFVHEGEIYVCGRAKDMIIIRGLNYYPQDIELLVEEDPFVRKGCVAAFSIEKNGHENLVVVVGVKNKRRLPNFQTINKKVINYLGIAVHCFVFVPARTVSRTSSGKIKRHDNKQRFLRNEHEEIERVEVEQAEALHLDGIDALNKANGQNIKPDVVNKFSSVFSKYHLTGTENVPLGDSGLDSIKLAEFAHDIKAHIRKEGYDDLSEEVDLRLLQKIAVSELFGLLHDLQTAALHSKFRFKQAFARIQKEYDIVEKEMMKRDVRLSAKYANLASLVYKEKAVGHILLTGGTGFFGPFIMKSLLEQNREDIYVIVRATDRKEGKERLRKALGLLNNSSEIKEAFEKRIKPICGDISLPKLGLNREKWSFLSENIHTIYHNGALVNYLFNYEAMRSANVEGTNEIMRLAFSGQPKILNHISTTFIFGWSVKDTLYESDENENMEHLDFGYSQSKWVSEQIVKNAMKGGLKARIFRPALISPSINGEGYNFDISIRLLAFMFQNGLDTSARNQVSFTPADIAANNIVAISNLEESVGKTFHVTRDTFSKMRDVTAIYSQMTGKPFKTFPLADFVPEVVSRCGKDDLLFPLLNFLVRSEEKIRSMEFKLYDNNNYRKYRDLSPFGKKDKPLTDVVAGIVRFMQSQGVLNDHIKFEKHG